VYRVYVLNHIEFIGSHISMESGTVEINLAIKNACIVSIF